MSLMTKALKGLPDGNVLITVSDGTNSEGLTINGPMLLQAMNIDLQRVQNIDRLARDAKAIVMAVEALGNDSRLQAAARVWLNEYESYTMKKGAI